MDVKDCPKCGRPMAYLPPPRDRHFCNFCAIALDTNGRAAPQPEPPVFPDDVPEGLKGYLPAEPPSEAALYATTTESKPVVRRSTLGRGTMEPLSEQETRDAVRSGDFLILSNVGRCAIVAARKALGEARIQPLALEMPGMPWRVRLDSQSSSIQVGLFRPGPVRGPPPFSPAYRMSPQAPGGDYYVVSLGLKGPPAELARFVHILVQLLGRPPWSEPAWNALSQMLGMPASKMTLDWKQYLDHASARVAAGEVAAAEDLLRETQRSGLTIPDAILAVEKAKRALSQGEWEQARGAVRGLKDQVEGFRSRRAKVTEALDRVRRAASELRKVDPASGEAAGLEEEALRIQSDQALSPEEAAGRGGELLSRAGKQLFSLHVARANALLSDIQGEDPTIVRELRETLEEGLARGRSLIEEGKLEEGNEVLLGAASSSKERMEAFRTEMADSTIQELADLASSEGDNPALDIGLKARCEAALTRSRQMATSGSKKEAGRLAREMLSELQAALEGAAPEIRITLEGPPMTSGGWNKVVMKLHNTGNADAANVVVSIDGPVELMAQDEIAVLKSGAVYNDSMAVRCESFGSVPVKLQVDCERDWDSTPYHFESEVWLEFRKPLDLSGAKTITIDRSVHIVDSVLSRSSVGGDEAVESLPGAPEEERVDESVQVKDSMVSRERARGPERECPSCGRRISTEWKRCPYCG